MKKNEFLEKAFAGEAAFIVNHNRFFQVPIGKAVFIYECHGESISDIKDYPNLNMRLAAMMAEGVLYYFDYISTGIGCDWKSTETVKSVYDERRHWNQYIMKEIFPEFYEKLLEKCDDDILETCRKLARKYLLSITEDSPETFIRKESELPQGTLYPQNFGEEGHQGVISLQDFVDVLCGFVTFEEITEKRLEERKDYYIYQKTAKYQILQMIENHDGVEAWELDIIKALKTAKSFGAKNVTVEFCHHGKHASGKMEIDTICRQLNNRTDIYSFNILECLEVKYPDKLTYVDVNRISYRKKVLYTKQV